MQDIKNLALPINVVKDLIDRYFTKDGPAIEFNDNIQGKKRKNKKYTSITINTNDHQELDEFGCKKLDEYLNPKPIYQKGEGAIVAKVIETAKVTEGRVTDPGRVDTTPAPSLYLAEISNANAANKKHRTPEMFYELEIPIAKEYQSRFPKYRKNDEHLKYWSILDLWIKFLEKKLNELNETPTIAIKKQLNTDTINFDDLFIVAEDIEKCIIVLRTAEPALLKESDDSNGKNKSSFCLWINTMFYYGIIRKENDETYTRLLNIKFPSLRMTIDGSLFRNISQTANREYKFHFDTELKKLKRK